MKQTIPTLQIKFHINGDKGDRIEVWLEDSYLNLQSTPFFITENLIQGVGVHSICSVIVSMLNSQLENYFKHIFKPTEEEKENGTP